MPSFCRSVVLTMIVLLTRQTSFANELLVNGVYLGKNVYIENPSCSGATFGTEYVYVNGELKVDHPSASTFEVDLSGQALNSSIEIRIIYQDSCAPVLINPQVIKPKRTFSFRNVRINEDYLSWETGGETGNHEFYIEKRKGGNWLILDSCGSYGVANHSYSMLVVLDSGQNQYRLKYPCVDGRVFYSEVVSYPLDKNPITFTPQSVSKKITLSRVASYEVLDPKGNLLASGKNKEINLKALNPGLYYLVIENRKEQFIKK